MSNMGDTNDTLKDMSAELAAMGRGSLQARIQRLSAALQVAELALEVFEGEGSKFAAEALERMKRILQG